MKKLYLIFNPHSGKANISSKIVGIVDTFTKNGYEVTVHPTQARMDAIDVAKRICDEKNYDLIVCSGGDGTLNEVIQGVMNSEKRLPIGYIPTGTTNDFARSLGIPKKVDDAVQEILNGKIFPCDIGTFNSKYFTYIAAFGAFTEVSYETPQQYKNMLGHAAYILEGMKAVKNVQPYRMTIEYNGNILTGDYVFGMVTNSSSVGGVLSNDNVKLDDGEYEVTMIKMPNNPAELQGVISSLLNLKEQVNTEYIHNFRTSELKIHPETEIPWTLDGEYGGMENDIIIRNNKQAVDFLITSTDVPKKLRNSKFKLSNI